MIDSSCKKLVVLVTLGFAVSTTAFAAGHPSLSTIAGTGKSGFSGDGGPAVEAQLNEPHSIAFDPGGDLYIADVKNYRIRKVDMKTGRISTFSGTGNPESTPDGAPISGTPLNG